MQKILALGLIFLGLNSCAPTPKESQDFDLFGNALECQPHTATHIINGRTVTAEEALAKDAILLVIQRGEKVSSCTGVPIAPRLILTAAHCVNGASPQAVAAIFHTDMNCDSGYSQDKILPSISYSIHQDFDGTAQARADLALVKLASHIPPEYPINILYDGKIPLSNDEVVMLGYGITDETLHDSRVLRTTTKSFKNDAYIKNELIGFRQDNESGGFCRGDSGAPFYVTAGGVKQIIGINSFNIGTSKNNECHTASAGMYVPYFAAWIHKQILELSD